MRDVLRSYRSYGAISYLIYIPYCCRNSYLAQKHVHVLLQWGPVEYHKQSLQNLQKAVKKTRRLCAVLLDTLGRELMIRRSYSLDEQGWPVHDGAFEVKRGAEVIVTTDLNAVASSNCMPITYPNFHNLVNTGDTLFIGR